MVKVFRCAECGSAGVYQRFSGSVDLNDEPKTIDLDGYVTWEECCCSDCGDECDIVEIDSENLIEIPESQPDEKT